MASEGFSDKQQPWQESNTPSNLLNSPEEHHCRPEDSREMTDQQDAFFYIPELWNLVTKYRGKNPPIFNHFKINFKLE